MFFVYFRFSTRYIMVVKKNRTDRDINNFHNFRQHQLSHILMKSN